MRPIDSPNHVSTNKWNNKLSQRAVKPPIQTMRRNQTQIKIHGKSRVEAASNAELRHLVFADVNLSHLFKNK